MKTLQEADRYGLRYRFAGLEVEPCEWHLRGHGEPVTLPPKASDTLVLGREHSGMARGTVQTTRAPAATSGS